MTRTRSAATRRSMLVAVVTAGLVLLALAGAPLSGEAVAQDAKPVVAPPTTVVHRTVKVDGLDVFYREAGRKEDPTILLLHGFPSSSAMFRNLIPALADEFHLIAPDYPGFGNSSMPKVDEFDYTFDHLADVIDHFMQVVSLKRYSL
jgi:alpha/beta hydrolase fold